MVQGATRPTGAVSPLLPVSVKRSASLAQCSALHKGDGSQVNGLRGLCCEGVMFLDWSLVCCSVLLCYYFVQSGMLSNVSAVGLLMQGVDTASINLSSIESMVTSRSY
jgi:hypothetical protein